MVLFSVSTLLLSHIALTFDFPLPLQPSSFVTQFISFISKSCLYLNNLIIQSTSCHHDFHFLTVIFRLTSSWCFTYCRFQITTTDGIWRMQPLQGWALCIGAWGLQNLVSRREIDKLLRSAVGSENARCLIYFVQGTQNCSFFFFLGCFYILRVKKIMSFFGCLFSFLLQDHLHTFCNAYYQTKQ